MTTLAGTLYVFQGQELGLRNVPLTWEPEEYKDIETINYWKKIQQMHGNNPEMLQLAKTIIQKKARDNSRTPMQWTKEAPNAGFCPKDVVPWMRVNDDIEKYNAESQTEQLNDGELSVFCFWKKALERRKKHKDAFVYGGFELLGSDDDENPVFAYLRTDEKESWAAVLNFSGQAVQWIIPKHVQLKQWVIGNYGKMSLEKPLQGQLMMGPWEGLLGRSSL
jgi:glycosidase